MRVTKESNQNFLFSFIRFKLNEKKIISREEVVSLVEFLA